jgi:hypothetical protein
MKVTLKLVLKKFDLNFLSDRNKIRLKSNSDRTFISVFVGFVTLIIFWYIRRCLWLMLLALYVTCSRVVRFR